MTSRSEMKLVVFRASPEDHLALNQQFTSGGYGMQHVGSALCDILLRPGSCDKSTKGRIIKLARQQAASAKERERSLKSVARKRRNAKV